MANAHPGYYDWGHTRQSHEGQLRRAKIDLQNAAHALAAEDPDTAAYEVMAVRYERAQQRVNELEADS